MDIQGKIIAVLPVKTGVSKTGSEWKSQEYVLETNSQHPDRCCFEVFGDNIARFNIQMGGDYQVSFDLSAREWNGRWFNSLRAWKVTNGTYQATAPQTEPTETKANEMPSTLDSGTRMPASSVKQNPFPPQKTSGESVKMDDLPF